MDEKRNSKKRKTRILVVEDSPTQAKQLTSLLEQNGYKVFVAPDGREALTLLKKHKPAVVVSDIVMPVMDGYELCSKIKSDEKLKDIPVILLTSLTDPEDVIKGLKAGADNFVTKPYSEEFILSQIRYLLANKELRKSRPSELGITISFQNQEHLITSSRLQIVDLLLSTFENAIQKNRELKQTNKELLTTQDEFKALNEELEDRIKDRTRKIQRLNSVLETIRNVNQLIVKERDRDNLIQGACSNFIDTHLYCDAWVVLLDKSRCSTTVAEAGIGKTFPALMERLKDGELTECMKRALAQPGALTVEPIASFCRDCSFRGDCSLANTPKQNMMMNRALEYSGNIYGILTVLASTDYISKEERSLFEEATDDIAFAINSMELEEKRKQAEEMLTKRSHDLGERVKELDCLYSFSQLITGADISLDEILQRAVNLIPPAWQYPQITAARFVLRGKEFATDNFKLTKWEQSADIMASGEKVGTLEVFYLEEKPVIDEGPFLKEERNLIDALVREVGKFVERRKVEEETEKHLRELEVFYKSAVGREERIMELKEEIKRLEEKPGGSGSH